MADKIIEGLKQALESDFGRATFFGVDYGSGDMGAIKCPKCDQPSTWSAPDAAPTECWNCGLRFRFVPS